MWPPLHTSHHISAHTAIAHHMHVTTTPTAIHHSPHAGGHRSHHHLSLADSPHACDSHVITIRTAIHRSPHTGEHRSHHHLDHSRGAHEPALGRIKHVCQSPPKNLKPKSIHPCTHESSQIHHSHTFRMRRLIHLMKFICQSFADA